MSDMKTTAPSKVSREIQKLLTDYYQKKDIIIENIVDFHYTFETCQSAQDQYEKMVAYFFPNFSQGVLDMKQL